MTTDRRRISARSRAALFERERRLCHLCGGLVHAGEAWDVSHEIPLACGGPDDETNWKVAHRKCHRKHTAKVDAPMIAKVRRQRQTHMGAKVTGSTMKSGNSLPAADPQRRATTPPTKVASGPSAFARRFGITEDA